MPYDRSQTFRNLGANVSQIRQQILMQTLWWIIPGFVFFACSSPLSGPKPGRVKQVDPSVACNAKNEENSELSTVIALRSESKSWAALVRDVLRDASIDIPKIYLAGAGREVAIDPTRTRFHSTQHMEFQVDRSVQLEAGSYQIIVENPSGERSQASASLEIVDPPTIDSVELESGGAAALCVGVVNRLRIRGSGFRRDEQPPKIEVVSCSDEDDLQSCAMVLAELEEVTVVSETEILATLPANLRALIPGERYGLRLYNPEQPPCTATAPVAFEVLRGVALTTVVPPQGWNGIPNPVQIYGESFSESMDFSLIGAAADGGDLPLVETQVDASRTRVDAVVPSGGMPGGPYDLQSVGSDGCTSRLPAAFTILSESSLTISAITPPFGWGQGSTPVSIRGTNFLSTPRAYLLLEGRGNPSLQPLRSTAFVTESSLTSKVQPSLPVGGPYDLVIINPDGGGGRIDDAFTVTQQPPPTIDTVTPGAGDTQNPVDIVVSGCNFRDPLTVDAVDAMGGLINAPLKSAIECTGEPICSGSTPQCSVTATLPTPTMTVAPYLIRVSNGDEETWGQWSLFVVTQPSAKLGTWQSASSQLSMARFDHSSWNGRIDNASRFVYVAGGVPAESDSPLGSIEVVPIDILGQVGTTFVQRNVLQQARRGASAIQKNRYVYVLGGRDANGVALDTIERAKILGDEDVPVLREPTVETGMLSAGTWYYQVAAIFGDDKLDNVNGESLPSDEVVISLGIPGGVALSWEPVSDAQGYRIYRSAAANAASSTEVFLAEVSSDQLTYIDDGRESVDVERFPHRRGSTGTWTLVSTTLNHARSHHQAQMVDLGNDEVYVYVVGGTGNCSGSGMEVPMDCYEVSRISVDGATLMNFSDGTERLRSGRTLFGLVAGTNANAPQITVGEGYLFATGGLGAASEFEAAKIGASGQLEAWNVLSPPQSARPKMRHGHAIQLVNNAMFVLAGSQGAMAGSIPLDSSEFSIEFDDPLPTRSSFSNSTATLNQARSRHSVTLESGFFYAIGGSADATGTNVLDTIEFIIY